MTCPFCGLDFEPTEAGGPCASCTLRRWACSRRSACCPRCGYESPLPPRWLRFGRKERVHGAE